MYHRELVLLLSGVGHRYCRKRIVLGIVVGSVVVVVVILTQTPYLYDEWVDYQTSITCTRVTRYAMRRLLVHAIHLLLLNYTYQNSCPVRTP